MLTNNLSRPLPKFTVIEHLPLTNCLSSVYLTKREHLIYLLSSLTPLVFSVYLFPCNPAVCGNWNWLALRGSC